MYTAVAEVALSPLLQPLWHPPALPAISPLSGETQDYPAPVYKPKIAHDSACRPCAPQRLDGYAGTQVRYFHTIDQLSAAVQRMPPWRAHQIRHHLAAEI